MDSQADLDDEHAWRAWRERKLADAPASADALIVALRDPSAPSAAERAALLERCRRWNMAIYAGPARSHEPDDRAPAVLARALGRALGLRRLDRNWLADRDGVSNLRVTRDASPRGEFIPYTDRPIRWHTDGYYNAPERAVRGLLLHCVQRAESGGENRLIDHEMAYLLLRDLDPAHVRALSAPDAMTIPARLDDGHRGDGGAGAAHGGAGAAHGGDHGAAALPSPARAEQTGPVFSRPRGGGPLHMRYTARTVSIRWRADPSTRAAAAALRALLDDDGPHVFRLRLEPGMGLVCNNVLHDRAGFVDSPQRRRWVLRARYLDWVGGGPSAPAAARAAAAPGCGC